MVDAITDRFPAASGPGQRRHLLRDHQPAAGGPGDRRRSATSCWSSGRPTRSNSRRLVETAERAGTPAYLVDGPEDIELGWLAGVEPIGITAGRVRAACVVVRPRLSSRRWPGLWPAVDITRTHRCAAASPSQIRPAQGGLEKLMTMPLRQSLRVGTYLMRQKLARQDKFPLLVELEPLFACNLKCAGCGKIQQPASPC